MQNHSGYTEEFANTVSLSAYPGKFPQTEQYLSLLKESDEAWAYLLDYFSQIDEKTVILLFGDHQPSLETEFYETVMAGGEGLENLMKQYTTSYFLWANYDLEVEGAEYISTNYLGSYLLDQLGVELPVYNQYLLELRKQIPAINAYGYLDASGTKHWLDEENQYSAFIQEYQMFQYNNLFDSRHRLQELYE